MKNNDLVQLTQDLRSITDADKFWARIKSQMAQYGVTSVFYGAYNSRREIELHGPTKSIVWKSDHPKEWFETFGEDSFLDEEIAIEDSFLGDEIAVEAISGDGKTVAWHDPRLWEGADREAIKRMHAERDMGLNAGFTVLTKALTAGNLGAIGVSMGELSPHEFDRMWPEKRRDMLAICGLLDMGMREQHLRSVAGLTARQEECLVWLAAGLNPAQIADRLTLSDKTIEHHISAAKSKLNAATRDHAVAKALMLNLIKP